MFIKHIWTKEEEEYLRLHYPTEALCDLADHFGVAPGTVKAKVDKMGIKKSADFNPRQFQHRWVKNYVHGRNYGRKSA